MIASTNLLVSILNLASLILGIYSIILIIRLSKKQAFKFYEYYLIFLVCSVISGFCDWIIFNWVKLLVPDVGSHIVDLVFHLLYDLIGFPAALFAFYYLVKAINKHFKIPFNKSAYTGLLILILLGVLVSYVSFYFRLQEVHNAIRRFDVNLYRFGLPFSVLIYLAFVYLYARKNQLREVRVLRFILLLFISYAVWVLLSIGAIQIHGQWRHLIIFSYYLTLFIPTIYLYRNRKLFHDTESGNKDVFSFLQQYEFTPREKELIILLLEGKSNQEISDSLFISLQTTKNYVSKIYRKAGLNSRVQFVNFIQQKQKL